MEVYRKGVIIIGIPVLILGQSGSGKSTSLRNFNEKEVGVFNVAGKPLPFRSKIKTFNTSDYDLIAKTLVANKSKCYVIDDSQYLMAFEQVAKAKEIGFAKYTDMGLHFMNLIRCIQNHTSEDTIVYFLHHTERNEDGHIKAKTVGKMIDNWVTLEGLFSIVLLAWTDGKKYKFITQSDGNTPCKSPMEMFPLEIDNDLKYVDTTIREYYGLTNNNNTKNGKED